MDTRSFLQVWKAPDTVLVELPSSEGLYELVGEYLPSMFNILCTHLGMTFVFKSYDWLLACTLMHVYVTLISMLHASQAAVSLTKWSAAWC